MEENKRNAGQGLGVASLILGIISFVVAFIPCVGILAIFTAVAAVVLGSIGISQATRVQSQHRGLNIGGLVVGIIALFVSVVQIAVLVGISDNVGHVSTKIEDIVNDIQKDFINEFEDGNFKITIDDGEQKVEINSTIEKKEMLNKLDELEGIDEPVKPDSVVKK